MTCILMFSVINEMFDVVSNIFRIVIHDHVTTSYSFDNFSFRNQNLEKRSTIPDDEISALQQRNDGVLRVDDQRRFSPFCRQKITRLSKVIDISVCR